MGILISRVSFFLSECASCTPPTHTLPASATGESACAGVAAKGYNDLWGQRHALATFLAPRARRPLPSRAAIKSVEAQANYSEV